jgi:LysR family nod box-dependent transcriptional activator
MDVRNVDLNLLIALDALLAERSVTRAGRRLGLSQSAVSGSLARLRRVFGDPLMVRVGRDLELTPRAEALIEPVREILGLVTRTLEERPDFDPGTAQRTFSISASDYATLVLLGPLIRAVAVEAPSVTIHVLPRSPDVPGLLRADAADLVIEPRELMRETEFPAAPLFADRWLCAVDAANPAGLSRMTGEDYRRLPHLVYSIGADRQLNLADRHVAEIGIPRRIEVTVESFLLVPFLVRGTPLASLVLERAATLLAADGIRLLEPPVPIPDIHEWMYWNPRHTVDPGHRWMRERLAQTAADLG